MNFTPASPASVTAFLGVVFFVILAWILSIHRAYRANRPRRAVVLIGASLATGLWLGGLAALIRSGTLASLPLNGLPILFGAVLFVSVAVGFSPLGGTLAANLSFPWLVGFQAFRLPLELILHRWASEGTIPVSMTWTGQNWDIVSGCVALVGAVLVNHCRIAGWVANLVGLGLLVNVIRVAIMSSPLPFAWDVTPKLLLLLHLPYALIGPVCVGGALIGHLVLTRALLTRPHVTPAP